MREKITWRRKSGIALDWVWCSDTTPMYFYAQTPHDTWFAWVHRKDEVMLGFNTEEEARQWCEVHYACAA